MPDTRSWEWLPGRGYLNVDRSIGFERPAGIVGDLPYISIGIGERACRASPFGYSCVPDDRTASSLGFIQHVGYLLGRAHIVSQFDAWSPVATESSP